MYRIRLAIAVMSALSLPAVAGEIDTKAVLGGALGSATGAAIGSAMGGREGAIVGGGVGGAAGAALGASSEPRVPVVREYHYRPQDDYRPRDYYPRHDNGLHLGHYKHKHGHRDHDD